MSVDISALRAALDGVRDALVVGHSHPDGDCAGGAASLAAYLIAGGARARVLFPEPLPLRLRFLCDGVELLETLPDDLDGVTVICTDVASAVQLGSLREALEGRVAIRIDHHGVGAPYAAREFVDPAAAATGEILFDLYTETGLSRLPMTAKAAVFGAVASDTGCFKYANVTPATHLRAAALLAAGVDGARVNQLLFDTKDMTQIRAEGLAQSRLRLLCGGRVSAVVIENTDYTDGLAMSDFETAVDIARSVRGVKIAVVVKGAPKAGVYRVSLRGNDGTPVSGIAAAFGGGGHLLAAGCTVEAESGDAALQMLLDEVEKEK